MGTSTSMASCTLATVWLLCSGVWMEPLYPAPPGRTPPSSRSPEGDRKSTRLNSSHANISYAVFCLKKKIKPNILGLLRGSITRRPTVASTVHLPTPLCPSDPLLSLCQLDHCSRVLVCHSLNRLFSL